MTLADLIAMLNDLAVRTPTACLASVELEATDSGEDLETFDVVSVRYSYGTVVIQLEHTGLQED